MPGDFTADGDPSVTPFGAYDGANDAGLVFHEVTHGLSERLVTDAAGFGALSSAQAGAIGEGTSDFYAMDYLVDEGIEPDDPDAADVRLGRYLDDGSPIGVRFQPIDQVDGGYTYADFGDVLGIPEVHADGEIWAQTLWSLRAALIDSYDNVEIGTARARRYITAGLRLAPPEPSFLEMRNAILQTSVEDGDDIALWSAFAARGMGYFAFADGGDDVAPVADFTDPADLTQRGDLAGKVLDEDGLPVAGATVGVAGFDTGLGPDHTGTSAANGTFAIADLPTDGTTSTYPAVRARKPGYDDARVEDVAVPGSAPLQLTLVRDWSSTFSGAAVASRTGPDNSIFGCGPGGLIDDDPGAVWGTSRRAGGQSIVVELDKPIDVASVAIDPGAGCGDDPTASLGQYEVLGAPTANGPWTPLGAGTFGPQHIGQLTSVFSGNAAGLRYVRLVAKAPQGSAPGTSGEQFMDVAELRVRKVPGSPTGAVAVTGSAPVVGFAGATVTGSVTAFDAPVQVVIEYGTTTQYGQTATLRRSRRRHHAGVRDRRPRRARPLDALPLPRRGRARRPPLPGRGRDLHDEACAPAAADADAHADAHPDADAGPGRRRRPAGARHRDHVGQAHRRPPRHVQAPLDVRRRGAGREGARARARREAADAARQGARRRPPRPQDDQDAAAQREGPRARRRGQHATRPARAAAARRRHAHEDREPEARALSVRRAASGRSSRPAARSRAARAQSAPRRRGSPRRRARPRRR